MTDIMARNCSKLQTVERLGRHCLMSGFILTLNVLGNSLNFNYPRSDSATIDNCTYVKTSSLNKALFNVRSLINKMFIINNIVSFVGLTVFSSLRVDLIKLLTKC